MDILGKEREPARTPWWLLAIRLAAAAAIILAVAGPRWQPRNAVSTETGTGPLVLLIDDGWAAAGTWQTRIARASSLLEQAAAPRDPDPDQRRAPFPERGNGSRCSLPPALADAEALSRPAPTAFDVAAKILREDAGASAIWISDGVRDDEDKGTHRAVHEKRRSPT